MTVLSFTGKDQDVRLDERDFELNIANPSVRCNSEQFSLSCSPPFQQFRTSVKKKKYPPVPTQQFSKFVHIVRRLRAECPWDREQTHQSIRHSLIEETYEAIEALDDNNLDELRKELGDLLLHVAMHATMAEQEQSFTLNDVIRGITDKLIRRHPHVFGAKQVANAHEVKQNWERIKMSEGRSSLLDGVPRQLPALQRALRVQERAAKVGFDWKKEKDVWAKVREEGEELKHALKKR
ncbi:MAG: nucleoside triphosphate pyrophosphohydrolase, partial [Ignavibacteriae bacterium]|nr:nucleoside triphosphate pyrophosphohydrolase [Ignavibacteriota bacterium]